MDQPLKIALFDFDGTITYKNSMFEFIKFCKGNFNFYLGILILSPFLILHTARLISSHKAKEIVLTYFLGNRNIHTVSACAKTFSNTKIPGLIKKSALDEISRLQKEGYLIYIVSASAGLWLKDWVNDSRMKLIATELEVIDDKITGKISGKNCKGIEKLYRIKKEFENKNISIELAYGDSPGDKEMLRLAKKSFYRHFN